MKSEGVELCQGRFKVDIRKGLFTQRVVGTGTGASGQWAQHQA